MVSPPSAVWLLIRCSFRFADAAAVPWAAERTKPTPRPLAPQCGDLKASAGLATLRTCVRQTGPQSTPGRDAVDGRPEDDQPPAGDLPVHQAVRLQVRLSAHGPRDRQGGGPCLLVHRAR